MKGAELLDLKSVRRFREPEEVVDAQTTVRCHPLGRPAAGRVASGGPGRPAHAVDARDREDQPREVHRHRLLPLPARPPRRPAQSVCSHHRRPRLREHPRRRGDPVLPQEGIRGRVQQGAEEGRHPQGRQATLDKAPRPGCRRPGGRAAGQGRPAETDCGPPRHRPGLETVSGSPRRHPGLPGLPPPGRGQRGGLPGPPQRLRGQLPAHPDEGTQDLPPQRQHVRGRQRRAGLPGRPEAGPSGAR